MQEDLKEKVPIYSTPDWYNAIAWLEVAKDIPNFKKALFENMMRPRFYWPDDDSK